GKSAAWTNTRRTRIPVASLTDQEVEAIAQRIAADLGAGGRTESEERPVARSLGGELGVFDSLDKAVGATWTAFSHLSHMGLAKRKAIIAAIRDAMREHGQALAKEAHEETGLGRYEDKIIKNQLVTEKTPGTEDLQAHAVTGDGGLNL